MKRGANGLSRGDLKRYVRALADRVGLRDWTFVLLFEDPENPGHGANIEITYGRKYAVIRYRRDWVDWSPRVLRQNVVHELLHAHLEPLRRADIPYAALYSQEVWNVATTTREEIVEQTVDALATNWAETLPLPTPK